MIAGLDSGTDQTAGESFADLAEVGREMAVWVDRSWRDGGFGCRDGFYGFHATNSAFGNEATERLERLPWKQRSLLSVFHSWMR